ncbi:MAG: copper-binding protein [Burkholderiales bacterium]|nr:copper-binding protein [Burkholderiales bacterium]
MKRRNVVLAGALGAMGSALAGVALVFAQGSPSASGEVMKVDKAGGRVEIRHGEIKSLDMPPMRMVFRVREPRLLEGLAVGDKVKFTAEKVDGQFTITTISKAP